MENMLSYVKENMKTFEEEPFSEVDSLVLSWLSYLSFPESVIKRKKKKITIRDFFLAEHFEDMVYGVLSPQDTVSLLAAVAASPRFRDMALLDYEHFLDHETSTQFAAVTFQIQPEFYYVAYRGTDGTFIGWKEDLDLTLSAPIMAQSMAKAYMEQFVEKHPTGLFLVGGHSKGGNLAVYASAKAPEEVQERILRIYSHDGPGFVTSELQTKGFKRIRNKITKTIPQSSLIGLAFEQECDYKIVRSNAVSIMQHNPFTWEVQDGAFQLREELTPDAKHIYKRFNTWLSQFNEEERKTFIDAVFEILEETGVTDFAELGSDLKSSLPVMTKKFMSLDKEKRDFLLATIKNLGKTIVRIEKKSE